MRITLLCCSLFVFFSCNNNQIKLENHKKGKMHATMQLSEIDSKSFFLDSDTAPKPLYVQVITDSLGEKQLTFLNNYNNSIYFYEYKNMEYVKKITFDEKGPNGVPMPMGYHIKNIDSIYVFSGFLKISLTNSKGEVLNNISTNGGHDVKKYDKRWAYIYPEFYLQTVTPFMETSKELLLTGQFSGSMPDSIIDKFKVTASMNFNLNKINYKHTYPRSIFGNDVNWGEGLFKQVFPQLHPNGKKIIYSFPISHDLFISDINGGTSRKVYAGSNFAGTIHSINKKPGRASAELIRTEFVRQDMYASIIYDKYRKVYYRFLRKAIPNAPIDTSWKDKEIAVIIMDEDFNYLGETSIGTERKWHWQNSFVTEEGLNIESLEENNIEEVNLVFKIFIPKKIIE